MRCQTRIVGRTDDAIGLGAEPTTHERHHEGGASRRDPGAESEHDPVGTRETAQVGVVHERSESACGPVGHREARDLVGQPHSEVSGRRIRHQRCEPTLTAAGRPTTCRIAGSGVVDEPTGQIDRFRDAPFVDAQFVVSCRSFATAARWFPTEKWRLVWRLEGSS